MPNIRIILTIALLALIATAALAQGAPSRSADPAAGQIAAATELSKTWGRCPTARPAHRALSLARRTKAAKPRVRRARAAVRAWRGVERDCSKPIDQPTVVVGTVTFVPVV